MCGQAMNRDLKCVARPSPALHISLCISSRQTLSHVASHELHPCWDVLQEEKLEKERLERERKLKQKQKAKDRVRSEKEKLAAEKEAAEREARERSEEQLRLQEQQSLAARSATTFALPIFSILVIRVASCDDATSPSSIFLLTFSNVLHCKQCCKFRVTAGDLSASGTYTQMHGVLTT